MRQAAKIYIILFLTLGVNHSYALEIVEPSEGQKVEVGAKLRVVVRPAPGERWKGVGVAFESLSYDSGLGAYVGEFPVPRDARLGSRDVVVSALSESDQESKLKRKINIVLPPTIVLQSIRVNDYQRRLFLRTAKKEALYVYGQFSDGDERLVSSGAIGTTYTTSDSNVATIDPDGLVTAQSPGQATITIKNGGRQLQVEVHVKPLRQ